MNSCFVTDTDTDKILVATALLHALAKRDPRVVGMKPVAAGRVRAGRSWADEDENSRRASPGWSVGTCAVSAAWWFRKAQRASRSMGRPRSRAAATTLWAWPAINRAPRPPIRAGC